LKKGSSGGIQRHHSINALGLHLTRKLGPSLFWLNKQFDATIDEHRNGGTHTTKRLGIDLQIVAQLEVATMEEARNLERELKRKKNPALAIRLLQQRANPLNQ
jgi:hypothetical protein